jgi:LPS O-antigen subunit length determinant protein (WzzB/FepE family)
LEEKSKEQRYLADDEIDLYELCLVLKKRAKLILGILLGAVLLTGVISFMMTPVYRSSFIVRMPTVSTLSKETIISAAETEKIINGLKGLRDKRNKDLSERLEINENKIHDLVSLTAKVPGNQENFVEITTDVYDPSLVSKLRTGVIDYLNRNQYVKERIALERKNLIQMEQEIQTRIDGIDGLKDFVVNQIKKGRIRDLGFNPIDLDKTVIDLKQRLYDTENDLQLLKGFEVAVEPTIPQKPVKPKKVLYMALAGITSLFISIFIAFIMEWAEWNKKVTK